MENSLPSIIWIFYVAVPIVGMVATIMYTQYLNKKERDRP